MKILVIAAHPDDEVLGCGGTIAKLSGKNKVSTLILGEGVTSRIRAFTQKTKAELSMLRDDIITANMVLGVKNVYAENLPDNKFDTIPLLDITKIIEKHVEKIQPEIVYTHHYGDLNIDHRIVFNAVLTACRPLVNCSVKKILSFEVPSSTEWNANNPINSFNPTVFENIHKTMNKKIEAMSSYRNEIRTCPHPRSAEKIKALAEIRGSNSGMEFAEAFVLIRELRE